jgi:pSer/pThr/pTyr-binding forkhead associated (FHA) protein
VSPDACARLVWERADGVSIDFPLEGLVSTIGRGEESDVFLDEPLVSRDHARVERRGAQYFVVDLGSTNLTRVNGQVVRECRLQHGDEVRFARARCLFLESLTEVVAPA